MCRSTGRRWLQGTALRSRAWPILAVSVGLVVACGSGKNESPTTQQPQAETSGENEVVIRLIAFRPKTLGVRSGATVIWKQRDAGFHTVTSGTASIDASGNATTNRSDLFASKKLAKRDAFSFTFEDAGTYRYFCEIHPATMRASVKVK